MMRQRFYGSFEVPDDVNIRKLRSDSEHQRRICCSPVESCAPNARASEQMSDWFQKLAAPFDEPINHVASQVQDGEV